MAAAGRDFASFGKAAKPRVATAAPEIIAFSKSRPRGMMLGYVREGSEADI